jgi:hypothetical protein
MHACFDFQSAAVDCQNRRRGLAEIAAFHPNGGIYCTAVSPTTISRSTTVPRANWYLDMSPSSRLLNSQSVHIFIETLGSELNTTRIEPDYSGRKRMRREGNGVDMQSLAAEIGRGAEASARASRSADYDGTDPLQEIRRRLRKLTHGDMIAMAEQITGLEGYKPAANTEEMAAMLHRWSTTDPSDEPQSPTVRSR